MTNHKTILEKFFSVTNQSSKNYKIYRVINILGLKIKIRNKRKEQKQAKERQLEAKIKKIEKELSYIQQRQLETKIKKIEKELSYIQQRQLETKIKKIEKELSYIQQWQSDFYKETPENFPVILSENEQNTLIKYLQQSNNYAEFGAGGSTFLILLNSTANIYSVESDINWINYLRSWKFITTKEKEEKIQFYHVDIGKIADWGMPIDDSKKDDYPNYSASIFNTLDPNIIDTVFIDGRFRVACTLATIKNCSKNTIIILHDYTVREHYHIIEEFLDIVEKTDTLVVFRIKENVDANRLNELYEDYKYIKA